MAAFSRYGRQAASTRQRLLQYGPALAEAGIEVRWHPLLPDAYVQSIADGRSFSRRAIAAAYLARIRHLIAARDLDLIWIYAELFPYLAAGLERLALPRGTPVVLDWDDAFFHTYDHARNPLIRALLGSKFAALLARADACICGNDYLRDYAARYTAVCPILPTVVDTSLYGANAPEQAARERMVIGWIGSPSTWPLVRPYLPLLAGLCRTLPVEVHAIGAGAAAAADAFPGLRLIPWSEAGEVSAIRGMDIGIMPLPDEPFMRGKCGYKLIQYMACGVPVVASPVGANVEIVQHGTNGLLAKGEAQWRSALLSLLSDEPLRRRMGRAGRALVEERYSLAATTPKLVALLRSLAG